MQGKGRTRARRGGRKEEGGVMIKRHCTINPPCHTWKVVHLSQQPTTDHIFAVYETAPLVQWWTL